MTSVLFYEKPVLLNRETHRNKKIKPADGLDFARKANSLYVAGIEFPEACKSYPIVFAKQPDGTVVPVAMLGLRPQENLFVKADGSWAVDYIPAFVRRYPFVLAQLDGEQLGVCIDEACPAINDTEGEALFDSKGESTPFLQNALDFLNRYQMEHSRTAQFCARVQEADLLTEMNAKADMFDGTTFAVNGLLIVDERKLLAMPDDKALAIFRSGELAWIYAHLVSLANMNKLVNLLADVKRAEPAPAAA